ncbi:Mob1/phocein, partial [Basidiobolus meristosporus CBS 931.73]
DAYRWGPLPFDEIDSVFALQEYLQSIIRDDRENIDRLLEVPENQNPDVWQYEHFKQICLELNYLIIQLQTECTKESCPEMKADEWLYLCAAHPTPQGCCAIDYAIHTLDGASAILNSNKYFPSRMSIHETSKKHYQSIARRLYRIFAHSWFHHRQVFDEFENETYLYTRFMALSAKFDLIPNSLIIIPDLAMSDQRE